MIKEILEAQPGIIFRDDPRLADMGIYLNPAAGVEIEGGNARAMTYSEGSSSAEGRAAVVTGPAPPEADDCPSHFMPVDARPEDVVANINDKLKSPAWWLPEFLPFVTGYQDEHDVWHNHLRYVVLVNPCYDPCLDALLSKQALTCSVAGRYLHPQRRPIQIANHLPTHEARIYHRRPLCSMYLLSIAWRRRML